MLHASPEFAARVLPVLERLPNPPRPVSTIDCIKERYRERLFRHMPTVGAGLVGLATYTSVSTPPNTAMSVGITVLVFLGGLAFIIGPAAIGAQYAHAIGRGRFVTATVLRRKDSERWLISVPHPNGVFEVAVSPNPNWLRAIGPGAGVATVVHPVKLKVLMILGPTTE